MEVFLVKALQFISWIIGFYMWIVIAAAVLTWVNPDPRNPIVRFLYSVTEPVLWRIRRLIPTSFGGFDISPVLLIFAIYFVRNVLIDGLISLIVGQQVMVR